MINNKINVYLDFDSTIVDSASRFIEIANRKYNKQCKLDDLYMYSFQNLYGGITKEEIHNIFGSEEFFNERLEFMPKCKEVLEKYKNDFNFMISTASSGSNLTLKKKWVSEKLPFIKEVLNSNNNDKSSINMNNGIQIDDVVECLNTNASIKILFKNGKNYLWQRHDNDDLYNVDTWDEIDDMLYYYLQNGVD